MPLVVRARAGVEQARRGVQLVVYQPDRPLTTPGRWSPGLPPVPVRAWLEQGFGFLVVILVHLVGMNTLTSLERGYGAAGETKPALRHRFVAYRIVVRIVTLGVLAALAVWLWSHHGMRS